MALYGGYRDVSLFRHLNRELLGDIITQQCAFYKYRLKETKANIYGESSDEKYFVGPILMNCLVKKNPQSSPVDEGNIDRERNINFKFLRDDFLEKTQDFNVGSLYGTNFVPEIGDVILYQEGFYEVYNIINNQYFMGKNPTYPNESNPLNPGLVNFGWNISIICECHYIPEDKLGLINRLI